MLLDFSDHTRTDISNLINHCALFVSLCIHIFLLYFFQDERDETSKFEISVCDDFSGRWAFKSLSRGYFLGASPDNLQCNAKSPGDAELWFVHLAARPQVRMYGENFEKSNITYEREQVLKRSL